MQEPVSVLAAMEALNNEAELVGALTRLILDMEFAGIRTPGFDSALTLLGRIEAQRACALPSPVADAHVRWNQSDVSSCRGIHGVIGIDVSPVEFSDSPAWGTRAKQRVTFLRESGSTEQVVAFRVITGREENEAVCPIESFVPSR